jgi:hypothetical protein
VGLGTGLDDAEVRDILPLPGLELQPSRHADCAIPNSGSVMRFCLNESEVFLTNLRLLMKCLVDWSNARTVTSRRKRNQYFQG